MNEENKPTEEKQSGDYISDAAREIAKNNATLLELAPPVSTSNAEMGEKIFGKALEQLTKKRSEEILDSVAKLVRELETARLWERQNRECAEIIEKKIEAVRAGAFEIRKDYSNKPYIVFFNKDFNKPYPYDMGFGQ